MKIQNPSRSALALLASALAALLAHAALADATLDTSFNPGASESSSWSVNSLVVQPDGKIVVAGRFDTLDGRSYANIGRLHSDGSADILFNPGVKGEVTCMALQSDGKILVGGDFPALGGQSRTNLGRLHSDGSIDVDFNPAPNGYVNSFALQVDGKILVGGYFTAMNGQSRSNIARLNVDGSSDTTFKPQANGTVYCLALQPDGKVLVGGSFTGLADQSRSRLARLNADGSLDTSFNPGVEGETPCSVYAVVLQPDGKILVGGSFTGLAGQIRPNIGRLNSDGSADVSFNPAAYGESFPGVYSMALQADGKILVGGTFTMLGGQLRTNIGRLDIEGRVDPTFNVGADESIYSFALQTDGKILVGGSFTTLCGEPRTKIGRLNNTEPATHSLALDGSAITWLRGGTSPEVWHTTFEASTNGGAHWLALGSGTRSAGGWQLGGVSLPLNTTIRARGYTTGGYHNASSWFCESFIGGLTISSQPFGRTNNAGTTASFAVQTWDGAGGPNSYQWRKDGTNLIDGGNVTGAQTAMLILTNVFESDEGGYSAVVTNLSGTVTSVVARLSVTDPFVLTPPTDLVRNPGGSAIFKVTAVGTPPLSYQWLKEGKVLSNKTTTSLSLTNLNASDAGYYAAVVSNQSGYATSSLGFLAMNLSTVDDGFDAQANGKVYALALQPDGKILAGGLFRTLGGQSRTNIGRFNADGSLDGTFNPAANGIVTCFALQPDGKILVGGSFTTLLGQPHLRIGRLNSNGTLDSSFNTGAMYAQDAIVNALAVQEDGKILVGGRFDRLGGQVCANVGRLNVDGSLDSNFLAEGTVSRFEVWALAIQPDGKILVAGSGPKSFGRLNADGSLDTTFNPQAGLTGHSLAVQPDGRIVVDGNVPSLSVQYQRFIGRIHADGTLDSTFKPVAVNQFVRSIVLQANGKILVAGEFASPGLAPLTAIARLNSDGSLDTAFSPGANGWVYSMVLQTDGKVLLGGNFTTLGGQSRKYMGRLNNTEAATQSLTFNGSTVTWLRGGSSPDVPHTTFEVWTNGSAHWIPLGRGERIVGGWKVEGLNLPANSTIRARGHLSGSGWFCESFIGPLVVLSQPGSRTNNADTTASFSVEASNDRGLTNYYQWRKNGTNIPAGITVSGARTPTLVLDRVMGADQGDYTVVISNSSSSVTSVVARLTVLDPLILKQPTAAARNVGEAVTFTVTTGGTAPMSYQWQKDAMTLLGQTNNSLSLTNLAAGDGGYYSVVISNRWGSVTSAPAALALNYSTLDKSFNPGAGGATYPAVWSLALQRDGKLLVGGRFNSLGGQTCNNLGRLNPDGRLDANFNPGASGEVVCLALQEDGRIIVGGHFTSISGQPHTNIVRLNKDGTVDSTFIAAADGGVESMALQADGKILVGGWFTMLCGQARNYIGRLNTDGSVDTEFDPGAGGGIYSLELQADGKILVGGSFTRLGGQMRNFIGRLNPDGSLDTDFNPGADGLVCSLELQADGKILLGGSFSVIDGQTRTYIARVRENGSVDTAFNPGADGTVTSIVIQPDGKILAGGAFSKLGGEMRDAVGRVNPDGSPDTVFNPRANGIVSSLLMQPDGKIVVGGGFTALAGQLCSYIGRLNSTGGPLLPRIASSAPSLAAHEDGFGFNFTGIAGSFVVIEGSADLENWMPVRTNFLNTSVGTFRDPAVTNTPTRYYRLRVQ